MVKQDEAKSKSDPTWKTPSAIKDRPELEEYQSWYVEDFYRLTGSRQSGMGVGAVPVSEILIYGEKLGVGDLEEFLEVMQALDNAYLDEYNQKQQRENPKK